MASVNKVILIGNLGRDPETRYSAEGAAITNVSIATTDRWKDKASGEMKEQTEWHRVVFFNRLAEVAGEYLKKGRPIFIEGRLQLDTWDDKQSGQKRSKLRVIGETMQLLGGRPPGAGGAAAEGAEPARESRPSKPASPPKAGAAAEPDDDEIPF